MSSVLVAAGNEFHRTVRILKSPGQPPLFNSNALVVDKNGIFVEGDKLEIAVKNGRWVLTHLPAGSRPAGPEIPLPLPNRARFSGGPTLTTPFGNPSLRYRPPRNNTPAAFLRGRVRGEMHWMVEKRDCLLAA